MIKVISSCQSKKEEEKQENLLSWGPRVPDVAAGNEALAGPDSGFLSAGHCDSATVEHRR